MPNLAANHPQVVHFAVALVCLGVAFRFVAFTPWLKWTRQAATALILLGTAASAVAVYSGDQAHGPVERIPGVRDRVIEHEELGKRARNIFLVVSALELAALVMGTGGLAARTGRYTVFAYGASALVGVAGVWATLHAAEHGGEIVYEYAGGPGLRTGNPADVERLLVAGLYQQGLADRAAGRPADAARLIAELAARRGADTTVRLLLAESQLLDLKQPAAAVATLRETPVDPALARHATRKAGLLADAFLATGQRDSARVVLQAALTAFPTNARLKAKLDSIP